MVRATAQLINAETGYHLWSDTFDREITDIFAIQDEIALKVGEAMNVALQLPCPVQPHPTQKPTMRFFAAKLVYDRRAESVAQN